MASSTEEELRAEIEALKQSLKVETSEKELLKQELEEYKLPDIDRSPHSEEFGRGVASDVFVANTDPVCNTLHRRDSGGSKKKIVYLVRHAEALHNVLEAKLKAEAKAAGKDKGEQEKASKAALIIEENRDAKLSQQGQDQVRSSTEHFDKLLEQTHYPYPKTVLVSPLRRTLMTASIMFEGHEDMRATELIRERRTGYPADERLSAAASQPEFPGVNFGEIEKADEQTTDGYRFRPELKEEYKDVARRGATLLPFIEKLESNVIAIVSHKGFLRELLQDAWKPHLSCPEKLKSELSNAEVRVCEISWPAGGTPKIVERSLHQATSTPTVHVHRKFTDEFKPLNRQATTRSMGETLPAAVASSNKTDTSEAIEEAWEILEEKIGGPPTVALVFGHVSVNPKLVARFLRKKQPSLSVIGGSSMRGVISSNGRSQLGILGFDGWATRCGVGHVSGDSITDGESAMEAGINAARQATFGQMPDILFLVASPGFEGDVLNGINQVCKGVRVFGGSSANDMLIDGAADQPWEIYGSLSGWGASNGGVTLMAVWQNSKRSVYTVLSHCYGPTSHSGTITRADGRVIYEIDDRPAADVLLEWTGLSEPWTSKDFAQYAFEFEDRLVDVKGIGEFRELHCFADTASAFGRCSVKLVHIKPSSILGAIREVARTAAEKVPFDVTVALVVFCAGTSSMFSDEDVERLEGHLQEIAPDVLTLFTFGEQGNTQPQTEAFHGNNMLNLLFFG